MELSLALHIGIWLVALLIATTVVRSLRKGTINALFATLWFLVSLIIASFSFAAQLYHYLSQEVFHLSGGDHLVYATLFSYLLLYSFYLTLKVCRLQMQIQRVITDLSICNQEAPPNGP